MPAAVAARYSCVHHYTVYASIAAALAVAAARGGDAAAVALERTAYDEPAWSRDGGSIAVVGRAPSGTRSLYVIRSDGRGIRQLVAGPLVQSPTWSSDGKQIAFANSDGIFVVGVDGSGLRRIQPHGFTPAWSPGGRKIAYAWGDETEGARIYVVNPDGSSAQVAAMPADSESYSHPSWSPDGDRLVFYVGRAPDSNQSRRRLGVVGNYGARTRYVLERGDPAQPAWSPAARRIAYSDHLRWIAVFDLKTRRTTRLRLGRSPSWTTDGRRIAFSRGGRIYTMRADGSGLRRLR